MADTLTMYGKSANKLSDWTSGSTICLALCTSDYTPNQDTHEYWTAVGTAEVTSALSSGYTGCKTMSSMATTYTATSNETAFDATDVTWTGTITARYAVCYVSTGNAATSPLLFYITFTGDKTAESGNFTVQWNSEGIFKVTAS